MQNKLRQLNLKPSFIKLSSRYLLLVSIPLFLLCLALGSALKTSFHANELITQREKLTETNNIVYSLLIDLGHEDIFLTSEDNKFKEIKNLSIYQISKILNSYSKQIKSEALSNFNELAKTYVDTPINERRKIAYKLQLEAKKILSILRDEIGFLTEQIEYEMTKISSTMTLIISFAALFLVFSIFYNFFERRKWNELIQETTEAKKSAENLSNLKSQFLATVSHEVRTPLNGIIATAEVLETNPSLNSDAKLMCSVIQSSGNTLLRIINDILDYSKIESGNIHFNYENFNLEDLVDEIILTNKHRAHKKNIDLRVVYKNFKFNYIYADRDRLAQVLYNIIGNAIKFTNVGYVSLIIETIENKKNTFLKFTIKDTGIGISEDEKEKVFAPFIQIQTQGTSGEAGSGLGLSISKRIIDKLNGELTFESILGLGSEFTISLPIKKGTKNPPREANKNENLILWNSPDESIFSDHKTKKIIFVAEDNSTNQIVINTMLNHEKISHVLFSNGQELLYALEDTKPRLILMDCQMPIMDGYQATIKIKEKYPNLPVVAMTADATDHNIIRCKMNGFDGIMVKPLNINRIKELLMNYRLIKNEPIDNNQLITTKFNENPILDAISNLDLKFGKDKRVKIIEAFLSQIKNLDNELYEKLEEKNLEALQRIGHKFKSSSQILGANDFCKLFQNLEISDDINLSEKLTKDILIEKQHVLKVIQTSI